jgi:hypothetical protein
MKLNRLALFSLLVAVVLTSVLASFASAGDALLGVKQLRWKEVGAIVYTDTTFMTDEADTTRTEPIDTYDWDWDAIASGALTGGHGVRVFFVSSTTTNNGVTDSLYYTVEVGTGRDTIYAANTSFSGAVGGCALAAGGITSPNSHVWSGQLLSDPDSFSANNVYLVPSFRLRVGGDVGGSTPKVSGLKCYITYPQRAASR